MNRIIATVLGLVLVCGLGLNTAAIQTTDSAKELAKAKELTDQVVTLINERRYDQALPLAQQAAEIRQRLLAPDNTELGISLTYLAELYLVKKKEQDAEKTFQRALVVYESHPEQNQLALAKTLERLSYLRFLKHDYKSAEPLAWRAVLIKENLLGRADPKTIAVMKSYACIALMANPIIGLSDEPQPDEKKAKLRELSFCWVGELTDKCDELQTEDPVKRRAKKLEMPQYPAQARQNHHEGFVFVAILVDDQGNVINARPICGGFSELNAAGLTAARKSKFMPNTPGTQTASFLTYRFFTK